MPAPINRTALLDPGVMSEVNVSSLEYLDDIFITHEHGDHFDPELIKQLSRKFPDVRITAPSSVCQLLEQDGIRAQSEPPEGVRLFESPHEAVEPLFARPEQMGVHYLDKLSHPGDSHHFNETMPVLALPVTAPWGATVYGINHGLSLKPQYILPIHDWHWRDEAREQLYHLMEKVFAQHEIRFLKLKNGEPVVLDI
jgi:L-ascorbate metabolism protein UlaG (beta-lactamase superfamily)